MTPQEEEARRRNAGQQPPAEQTPPAGGTPPAGQAPQVGQTPPAGQAPTTEEKAPTADGDAQPDGQTPPAEGEAQPETAEETPVPVQAYVPEPGPGARPQRSYEGYDYSIAELRRAIAAREPEDEEARRKRERRDRARRVIASVGDGLTALANLHYTTQYAPNMYDPANSQRRAVDAKQKEEAAAREKREREYMELGQQLGNALEGREAARQKEHADAMANWLRANQEGRAQREHEAGMALQPYQQESTQAAARRAKALATQAEIQAAHAEELNKAKVDNERKRGNKYDAEAGAARQRGWSYASGGGRGKAPHHYRGREYASDKDYTKAVNSDLAEYNAAAQAYNKEVDEHNNANPNDQWEKVPEYSASEMTANGTKYTPVEQYAGTLEKYFDNKERGLDIAGRSLKKQQPNNNRQELDGLYD